jgi:hypothetical protein
MHSGDVAETMSRDKEKAQSLTESMAYPKRLSLCFWISPEVMRKQKHFDRTLGDFSYNRP